MTAGKSTIIYTLTDEAPLLATCVFSADHQHLHRAGRHRHRQERHFGGGAHPGRIPRIPDR